MATGVYDGAQEFEDYITIVTDNENPDNKKINIGSYIKTEEINRATKTENIEAEVLSCDTYMDYVTYKFKVKNITDKDILLDNISDYNNIKLMDSKGRNYKIRTMNLKTIHLEIGAGKQKHITLSFKKQYGDEESDIKIQFENVILDYSKYIEDKDGYNEYTKISINL